MRSPPPRPSLVSVAQRSSSRLLCGDDDDDNNERVVQVTVDGIQSSVQITTTSGSQNKDDQQNPPVICSTASSLPVPSAAARGPLVDTDLRFDSWQFGKTFLYESLPMYVNLLVILPVELLLEKRSWREVRSFCRNRLYILVPGSCAALPLPVQLLALFLPNVMLPVALILWCARADVRAVLDFAEILAFWVTVCMRNAVVAQKYAFLDKADVEDQYDGKGYVAPLRMGRRLFMAGWATPQEVDPRILWEELQIAMSLCDCDLRAPGAALRVKPTGVIGELQRALPEWAFSLQNRASAPTTSSPSQEHIGGSWTGGPSRRETGAEPQPPPPPHHDDYMSAFDMLALIVRRTIADPLPGHRRAFMLMGIVLPFLPPIMRALGPGGLPAFGDTWASNLACSFCVFAPAMYVALMAGFSQVAIWTYSRRGRAMKLLDALCLGGCELGELCSPDKHDVTCGERNSTWWTGCL